MNHNYLIYQDTFISKLDYGVCYYVGISSLEDFNNISTATVFSADANMLGLVVEAYLTYGKDDSNGSTKDTVTNLNNTWFVNKSATDAELKKQMIMDYNGYANNGNSYKGLKKEASYSVHEKWNTMKSHAGLRTGFNFFKDLEALPIIIIAATSVSVIALAIVLMIIRDKRKAQK